MDNVLSFWLRSFSVMVFVLAMSVAVRAVNIVNECTEAVEKVMEYDDVLHRGAIEENTDG